VIKFACSKCGKPIRVDDKHAGKKGKCPGCGEVVVVPGTSRAIAFRCAGCGHTIKVPQSYAGKRGKCPKCKEAVVVPAPKKKPVAETQAPTITCSMCGQAIGVPEGAADAFVKCPECGSYLDPSSGEIASRTDNALPTDVEEDLDDESDETTRESAGLDRRLLLILAGVAAVVVVGLIGLIVVLKSRGSSAANRPDAPPTSRRIADTSPAPQPTRPAAPSTERPAVSASTVRLRFAPTPGTRRTLRVTTEITTSAQEGGQQQEVTGVESVTLDLETASASADGTVPIRITLAAIQVKSGMAGTTMGEYDSAKTQDNAAGIGAMYAPFIGKDFTMSVSDHGEIIDPGMDELFRAAAEHRVKAEDTKIREGAEFTERAEQIIARTDQRFESRENRVLAMKKQLEEFPIFGKKKLSGLLSEFVVALPDEPLHTGDHWSRPITISQVHEHLEMATTHILTALEDDSFTIESEGQRSLDEAPIIQEMGQFTMSHKLGGDSQTTLTVDRRTGWLLSKEQSTNLSGQVETRIADKPEQDTSSQVSLEITTTVTTVE